MQLKVIVPEVLEFPVVSVSSANWSRHYRLLFSRAAAGRRKWALICSPAAARFKAG